MKLLLITFLTAIWVFSTDIYADIPSPGKQIAQTIELPKNMTFRKRQTDEEREAEKARRAALSKEERAAEDQERKIKSFEALKNPTPLSPTEKESVAYWLFLPRDYQADAEKTQSSEKASSSKKYPLLLFLHGSGERGSDIDKVKVHGPPKLLADAGLADNEQTKDWPFITVSPQCPENYGWSPLQLSLLLDDLEKRYAVDKSRIYVTGLSMGGFGTWSLLYHSPNRFAAGAPICGGCNTLAAPGFVNIPLWIFHGEKDEAVPVKMSTDMLKAIKKAGGKKAKLTTYPDLDHDSWTVTYDNPELYRWFLEHKLTKKPNLIKRFNRRPFFRGR